MEFNSNGVMIVELGPDAEVFSDEIRGRDPLTTARESSSYPGVLIGTLAAWDDDGNPLVDYPNNPSECFLPARTTVPLTQAHLGREVALMLVNGDPLQPLII